MSSDHNTLQLNCAVQVNGRHRSFRTRTPPNITITDLIPEVVRVYEQISQGDTLRNFTALYKVDVPPRELDKLEVRPEDSELEGMDEVGYYWPDPTQLNMRHIHVLVLANVVPLAQPSSHRAGAGTVLRLTSAIEQLALRQENTARAFREAPSASVAAYHSEFEKQQAEGVIPIFNGRPYERTDIPIHLLHPVFNTFTAHLEQADELTATMYRATENFLFGSQAIYSTEQMRWDIIQGLLTTAIGFPIHTDNISNCHSNGVVTFTEKYSPSKAYGVIIELKNEIGAGISDPWIQGAQSFARYWSQVKMAGLRQASRCPSFIISIAGPWMCISGAVFLDRIVVQPLTDYIWLGRHPQQDHHLARMTRLFKAVHIGISSLQAYYTPFLSPESTSSADLYRFFPYIQTVQTSGGEVAFRYKNALGRPGIVRPLFQAVTEDGRALVVKFAQFYNFEAHQLLAAHSLAPKLLSLRADPVGQGLVMIVMELSGKSLDNYLAPIGPGLEPDLRDQVYNDVKNALDLLHANNLVFGDLRSPNVLVTETAKGSLRAQLVDFEWCGIEGEARYPAGMNECKRIRWAAGVEKTALLSKRHDRDMLEKLFLPPPDPESAL